MRITRLAIERIMLPQNSICRWWQKSTASVATSKNYGKIRKNFISSATVGREPLVSYQFSVVSIGGPVFPDPFVIQIPQMNTVTDHNVQSSYRNQSALGSHKGKR